MGSLKKLDKWCIFHKVCSHFRKDQFTCTHNEGDPYCGKYRIYKLIQELDQEILDLSEKLAKTKDPKQCKIIKKLISAKNNFKINLQSGESQERDLEKILHPEVL